jgi:fucose 4-O-acetylase-like acetyltransferase
MKIRNFDLIKGGLIILVIIGHVLQGSLSNNLGRYFIYSFHMPVFIGISGYLINADKLKMLPSWEIFKKYCFRVIIPWSLAVFAYLFFFNCAFSSEISMKVVVGKLIRSFISPYFHLWYIPAFVSWIFLTVVFLKLRISLRSIFLISLVISIFFYLLNYNILSFNGVLMRRLTEVSLHTYKPYFFMFFVFGMCIRNIKIKLNIWLNLIIVLILAAIQLTFFYFPLPFAEMISTMLLNFCLLHLLIALAFADTLPHSQILEWLGINSLAIYLWHIVPVLILKLTLGTENIILFYSACLIAEAALIIVIYYLTKIRSVNRFVFGVISK